MIPKFMIAGTASGVGKTTVAMGLMAALSETKTVQPYKVGPDYIDPAFHSYITGRKCRNLDSYLLDAPMIQYLFEKNVQEADLAVVEGVMGFFDGAEVGSDVGTSASIAKMLNLPVILVVSGAKVASSLAATVKGFDLFDPAIRIAGVIINHVGSKQHYDLLKAAIEHHTEVEVCGYLLKNSQLVLPERHLGLVPAGEQADLQAVFKALGEAVAETVDLKKILKLSNDRMAGMGNEAEAKVPIGLKDMALRAGVSVFNEEPVRIGIASDEAFNFYYQDALDVMETYGSVVWVPFSPMYDDQLPANLDGLYFGGGFPEMFPETLKANGSFIKSLLRTLEAGMPYIAECGGLMYLCDQLTDLKGQTHEMAGWLPGRTVMTKGLQRFGYGELRLNKDCIYGKQDDVIRIHEFHRSSAEVAVPCHYHLTKVRYGEVVSAWTCGYSKGKGIAGYPHMHWCSNLSFAKNFLRSCLDFQKKRAQLLDRLLEDNL